MHVCIEISYSYTHTRTLLYKCRRRRRRRRHRRPVVGRETYIVTSLKTSFATYQLFPSAHRWKVWQKGSGFEPPSSCVYAYDANIIIIITTFTQLIHTQLSVGDGSIVRVRQNRFARSTKYRDMHASDTASISLRDMSRIWNLNVP